jgi:peroxiredoxin
MGYTGRGRARQCVNSQICHINVIAWTCCDRMQPRSIENSSAVGLALADQPQTDQPHTGAPRIMIKMDVLGWFLPFKDLRKWSLVSLLSAGLWTPIAAGTAAESEPRFGATTLSALDGSVRPQFALPTLDGGMHDLAQHRGRVVLVHFFATWCEPCRPEMATLRHLRSRFDGAPIAIVAISVAEADGAVRRFFAGDPVPFSILLDRDRSVTRAWTIHTLPSTVVLDHDLRPRFMAEGEVDWVRGDVMEILADLLARVPGSSGPGGG